MADIVTVALVTGGCSIISTAIVNFASFNKIKSDLEKAQAITDVKLEALTQEVRRHNGFADRLTKLEVKIQQLEKEMS